jgi:hypothetical protein
MTKNILTKAILAAVGVALSATSASAQNVNYNQAGGDIVLFAQAFGGTQTLMLNIGTGQAFRDTTTNLIDIKNIGTELAAISAGTSFVGAWYDNPDMYWGVAGVRSNSDSNGAAVNGDGHRTIYTTKERATLGTEGSAGSTTWTIASNTAMTTGSSNIQSMTLRLETIGTTDRLVEGTATSNVDNQNPFLGLNPGTAFGNFPGGVMGNFDASSFGTFGGQSAEGALDLYRILGSTSAAGTVDVGTLRTGQYQGSFVIDQGGDISFIVAPVAVPEPTTMLGTLVLGCAAAAMRRRRQVAA